MKTFINPNVLPLFLQNIVEHSIHIFTAIIAAASKKNVYPRNQLEFPGFTGLYAAGAVPFLITSFPSPRDGGLVSQVRRKATAKRTEKRGARQVRAILELFKICQIISLLRAALAGPPAPSCTRLRLWRWLFKYRPGVRFSVCRRQMKGVVPVCQVLKYILITEPTLPEMRIDECNQVLAWGYFGELMLIWEMYAVDWDN